MKRLVWTNVAGTNIVELQHLSSEVEGEVRTNYGDEHEVERDDERKDNDGNIRNGAPSNLEILISHPHGLDSITFHRLDRLHSAPNGIPEEGE
jgi:hypothetical protein